MKTSDFHFDLPEDLIAQKPCAERGQDRLLCMNRRTGAVSDHRFAEIVDLIPSDSIMVFNDSRVRRARVYATADSSGNRCEFLLVSPVIDAHSLSVSSRSTVASVWKVLVKNAKRHRSGRTYTFEDGTTARIISDPTGETADTEFRYLEFSRPIGDSWLDSHGHMPLPPYIRREDELEDADRYQTVYSQKTGSVAAPTAGLHYTPEILSALDARGIKRVSVTLHVGLGTFLPVRTEHIEEHRMHEESYDISEESAAIIEQAKRNSQPVLAVGTTSIRTLESAWNEDERKLMTGDRSTSIFMYPGYRFKVVDHVFTNFHTPESTLLMLVSAFAGRENILAAYRHAVEKRYRFFSYGDSMLIL